MSDNYSKPVDFDSSAERAGQAAQEAARQMEAAAAQAAADAASAAQQAAHQSGQAAQQAAQTSANKVDELVDDLGRVGTQVADQAKTVWESDQRKDIQDQVVKGLSSVATVVEEQVKKLAANPEAQRFLGKVEEATNSVVEQARNSKSLQEAAEAVLKGLNSAATAIESWLNQQGSGSAAPSSPTLSPDDPQEIMIQRPATPLPPTAPNEGDKPTYV